MTERGQWALEPSPFCSACPGSHLCDEGAMAGGCLSWGPPHPNLLHAADDDFLQRVEEINGFDFGTIRARPQPIPSLPRYIPRTRINAAIKEYTGICAVAVSLREVPRLAAMVRATGTPAKQLLGLPDDHLLVVLGFERDEFLEGAWPRPCQLRLLSETRDIRPDLATAWGYSVWHHHADGWLYPRVEQLYSMKRSLCTYRLLQESGIPAVPHIYWGNHSDLQRWADWLSCNPAVSVVAIDMQTADSERDWKAVLQGVRFLRDALARDVRLIVNGPCKVQRIMDVERIWPGCTFTNFAAYFSMFYRHQPRFGLRAEWTEHQYEPKAVVFGLVVQEYAALLADLRSVGRPNPLRGVAGQRDKARPMFVGGSVWGVTAYACDGVAQLVLPSPDPLTSEVRIGAA